MRARNVKPGFFCNEVLAGCHPLGRILFAGLWCLADREGFLEDRPVRIKAQLLPFDDVDPEPLLAELHNSGLILRYEVAKGRFICIPNFLRHQRPHPHEPQSVIPKPDHAVTCNDMPLQFALNPSSLNAESNNEESNRSGEPEEPAPPPPASPLFLTFPCSGKPSTWELREDKVAEYAESYPGVEVRLEARKALQWCRDNPPKRKTFRGMPNFLSRWLARAQDRGGSQSPGPAVRSEETIREKVRRIAEARK